MSAEPLLNDRFFISESHSDSSERLCTISEPEKLVRAFGFEPAEVPILRVPFVKVTCTLVGD